MFFNIYNLYQHTVCILPRICAFPFADRQSHLVAMMCSGGTAALETLYELVQLSVPTVVLHGSGRFSDTLAEVWSERLLSDFDPLLHQMRLTACLATESSDLQVPRRGFQLRDRIKHPSVLCPLLSGTY